MDERAVVVVGGTQGLGWIWHATTRRRVVVS